MDPLVLLHPRVAQQAIGEGAARKVLDDALPRLQPFKGRPVHSVVATLDWDHRLPSKTLTLRLHVCYDANARTRFDAKTDLRSTFTRFSAENLEANAVIVDELRRFAVEKNATAAQLALAWLLARKPWVVPIPGTRNSAHLDENLGALDVVLSPADITALDDAFARLTVHGGRMNAMQMQVVEP